MLTYILRRLVTAVLILFAATFVVFVLVAYSGDPLAEFRESPKPNAQALMEARSKALHLDVPVIPRYFLWLGGALGCLNPLGTTCELGSTLAGQTVTAALGSAIAQTLLLVTAATVLSILIGIALGIVSALRQYSAFDYGTTLACFLFFSLPSFWIAVLLKEFGAIRFNNFLAHPTFAASTIIVCGLLAAAVWFVASAGEMRTRLITSAVGAAVTMGILVFLSVTGWFKTPSLGIPLILVLGGLAGLLFTYLISGLRNRRALITAAITLLVGLAVYFPVQGLLGQATWLMMLLLALVSVGVGAAIGWFAGGYDRGQNMRIGMLTAFTVAGLIALDRFMQAWPTYFHDSRISGRPIATANAATPGLSGDFWVEGIDTFTHLLLPTIAMTLVSLASYSRYSRASMLDIMSQDYVRTARAKGVPERVVVVKHAFRNALIPLATLVAFDIGGIIGGAVVTETVFGFSGMGSLFVSSLGRLDIYPIMGVFLVTGLAAMVANLLADLAYSVLDPRVRVKA